MGQANSDTTGVLGCWGLGIVGGVVIGGILGMMGTISWTGAIFVAILITVLVGGFLMLVLGGSLPSLAQIQASRASGAMRPNVSAASASAADRAAAERAKAAREADTEPKGAVGEARTAIAQAGAKTGAAVADTATRAKDAVTDAAATMRDKIDDATRPHRDAAADKTAQLGQSARDAAQTAQSSAADAKNAAADKVAEARRSVAASIDPDAGSDAGTGAADAPGEGTKPAILVAARAGGPDDLKEIKGVGPKLETVLNEIGIYHFDQIAGWKDDELVWVDENLEGFKGRASRDEWVAQAKILAAGGETAFSKKVDKGGVY